MPTMYICLEIYVYMYIFYLRNNFFELLSLFYKEFSLIITELNNKKNGTGKGISVILNTDCFKLTINY